jgi:hypothetical protein
MLRLAKETALTEDVPPPVRRMNVSNEGGSAGSSVEPLQLAWPVF